MIYRHLIIRLNLLLTGFLICTFCGFSQSGTTNYKFWISNPSGETRYDEPVVLDLHRMNPGFTVRSATVWSDGIEIPCQLDDLSEDLIPDELVFVLDIPANTEKEIEVRLSPDSSPNPYPTRVFAEMLVSDKNGKHIPIRSLTIPGSSNIYNQLHHHGPAFESELVAYRIYFDQKQTVDIYGKFNKGLEIEESQFYPTDEQLARGFGDDVLRVSGSCGLGTLKGWNGEKAIHIEPVETRTETIRGYGPVRTVTDVTVKNWEYQGSLLQMTCRYIIYAGHRDCEVQVTFDSPLDNEIFCTGVQNIKGSESFSDHEGLLGCWGTDWPVNDTIKYAKETVGLAVCLPTEILVSEISDKPNYLYQIQAPGQTGFTYYISFTSMKETFGYKSKEEWFAHIRKWKEQLNQPCIIRSID